MNRVISPKRQDNKTIIIMILLVLILFSTFNSVSNILKPVGFISLSLLLTITLYLLLFHFSISKKLLKTHLVILVSSTIMLFIMLIGLYNNPSLSGIKAIYQFVSVIGLLVFFSLIKWNAHKNKLMYKFSIILIIFLPIFGDIGFIGAYMVLPIFFVLLQRKKTVVNAVLIIICLYLIYLAGMRAVFLLLFVSAITYFIWNFISKTKLRFITYFLSLTTGLLSFVFIYPNLINWSKYPEADAFIYAYTGKHIMSGRNRIWGPLIDKINEKPFLGHGTGIIPYDVLGIQISSHNLYLQTALQNGLIGLIILFILFLIIWLIYFRTKNIYSTKLSASFFTGILVYQSFEVVLTQNKMDTAVIFWIIIAIGISNSIYKDRSDY